VEALVTRRDRYVELMERLDFENFRSSMKSTSCPHDRRHRPASARILYPLHLVRHRGRDEMGPGSPKRCRRAGNLLSDGIADTIRISLATFPTRGRGKSPGDP